MKIRVVRTFKNPEEKGVTQKIKEHYIGCRIHYDDGVERATSDELSYEQSKDKKECVDFVERAIKEREERIPEKYRRSKEDENN